MSVYPKVDNIIHPLVSKGQWTGAWVRAFNNLSRSFLIATRDSRSPDHHMIIDMQSVGSAMEVLFSRGWIAIGVLIVGILLLLKWKSQKFKRLPPVKSGPIPWLGCALQFGKAPLHVIRSAHQEVRTLLRA